MNIEEALSRTVDGVNLHPGTLEDQLGGKPTLVVFLRHLGCPFSGELLSDLKTRSETDPAFPPILFVAMGAPTDVERLLGVTWPGARVVSDPEQLFYKAFEVPRATLGQLLGPSVWACGLRAFTRGHSVKSPVGDVRQMPAFLVLDGPRIVWRHEARHAADHPDFKVLSGMFVATGS